MPLQSSPLSKKTFFKKIGNQAVDAIPPPEILKITRAVESRGSIEVARKLI